MSPIRRSSGARSCSSGPPLAAALASLPLTLVPNVEIADAKLSFIYRLLRGIIRRISGVQGLVKLLRLQAPALAIRPLQEPVGRVLLVTFMFGPSQASFLPARKATLPSMQTSLNRPP